MDATRVNSAVETLRKAGRSMERLDFKGLEANARLFGTGLSTTGAAPDALVARRDEVREAIRELAARGRAFVEAHRALEGLLG